jgi:magnesium transporter
MAIVRKIVTEKLKWIDVTDPSADEMSALASEYNLNEHTVRDCLQPEHLPKYERDEINNVDFLILRFYSFTHQPHISTIQELTDKIAIFSTHDLLITIHKKETPFLEPLAKRYESAQRKISAPGLLSRIIWQALETYDDPANRITEQIDFYEKQVMLKHMDSDITEALYYIKRQAIVSHKVLTLMLEPINHIFIKSREEAPLLQDLKDQHLKMQTVYGQIVEEVNNLLNLSMSFAAQRTNEVMRILTVFSVFFMPLTFIVGVYGMNFLFMPELRQKWGYPAVLLLMLVVAGGIYFWFKKKKWL